MRDWGRGGRWGPGRWGWAGALYSNEAPLRSENGRWLSTCFFELRENNSVVRSPFRNCASQARARSRAPAPKRARPRQRSLVMRRAWLLFGAATCVAVEHEMCESWAESGECESNPTFMQKECTSSCANAGKYKTQMQKECEGYALAGECSRNPAFMLSTCRKECDRWEASKGGAVSIGQRRSREHAREPYRQPPPWP